MAKPGSSKPIFLPNLVRAVDPDVTFYVVSRESSLDKNAGPVHFR